MWAEYIFDQLLRACVTRRLHRPEMPLDELELLLAYYLDPDSSPEEIGELLAQYLSAPEAAETYGGHGGQAAWPEES